MEADFDIVTTGYLFFLLLRAASSTSCSLRFFLYMGGSDPGTLYVNLKIDHSQTDQKHEIITIATFSYKGGMKDKALIIIDKHSSSMLNSCSMCWPTIHDRWSAGEQKVVKPA